MSERLENKMDEVLEKIGGLATHAEHTSKQLERLNNAVIPDGRHRMEKAEIQITANTRVRHILVFVTGGMATVIGWVVSMFAGGNH